jgi:cullin-4
MVTYIQVLVRSIFFYMDRAYLLPAHRQSIQELGMSIFRRVIFQDKQLQTKLIDGFCDLIASDRAGKLTSQTLSGNAVNLFHDLAVYTKVVEPQLLKLAQDFVKQWADNAAKTMTLENYARSAMELFESELKRYKTLSLSLSTRHDLEALLENHLVERQQSMLRKLLYQS